MTETAAKIICDSISPAGHPNISIAEFLSAAVDDLVRFRRRVSFLDNGCIQWSSVRRDGYGTFTIDGKCYVPQVWLYKRLGGVIPKGWTLDHVCRNRGCVNVFTTEHIEAVPHAVNISRAVNHRSQVNAQKTHCPLGHPYDAQNTYVNAKGHRYCRECWKRWRPK